jgi:hypothetical protein
MPILTETTHPRKRRVAVWLPILAVVGLLLVGLFGWSWYEPVSIGQGTGKSLDFGYYRDLMPRTDSYITPDWRMGRFAFMKPGSNPGEGYLLMWSWY